MGAAVDTKAIVVCDALEASLTGPPEEPLTGPPEEPEEPGEAEKNLMIRGELSARVIQDLPWESIGAILGLDHDHPSLSELSSKIGNFVKVVETGGTSEDLSKALKSLQEAWEDAVEAVRELRTALESVASILATGEADNIAEVALDRRAPLDAAGSLTESALRIGTVFVCGMVGAPVGAEIFHEPLVSAGVKAGITSLIGSTTAELMNYRIKSSKLHSPEAVFGRCHDQILTSLENYSGLTAGASREELVIARAHLVTDAYAARLATIRLDWPAKDQYWATVEGLQNAIGRGEAPQKLTVWRPRLWHLAQSLKDQRNLKDCDGIDLQEGSKQEDEAAVQPTGLDEDYPTVTQQPNQDLNSKYVAGSDMSSEPKIRQSGIGQRSINWRIGQESQEGPKKSK